MYDLAGYKPDAPAKDHNSLRGRVRFATCWVLGPSSRTTKTSCPELWFESSRPRARRIK